MKILSDKSLLCLLALFSLFAFIQSVELRAAEETKVTWTGRPFSITIPVGIERVVKFNADRIQVAFPTDLWGIATAESSQGVVYLRTSRPFENVRVRFRNKDNGKIYSLNVTAVAGETDLSPIVIVDEIPDQIDDKTTVVNAPGTDEWEGAYTGGKPLPARLPNSEETKAAVLAEAEPEPVVHGVTTLVRYAMQHVYAPERLIDELDDVSRISFNKNAKDISLVPGVNVKSRVLGQWKHNDRYITAVYLQNMSVDEIDLDPRVLTGRHYWQIAALMHSVLSPANSFGDSTTLVAISDKKWVEYSQWLH